MKLTAALVIGVLLAPQVAAWTQPHGSAARDGVAVLAGGPLDILANGSIPFDVNIRVLRAPGAVETPMGLHALARQQDGCSYVVIDVAHATTNERPVPDCPAGGFHALVGYDAASNLLLSCHLGRDAAPILQARDLATLETRWDAIPSRDFGAAVSSVGEGYWLCLGGAIDPEERRAVVPFVFQNSMYQGACVEQGGICTADGVWLAHRVASFDLDTGELLWARTIQTSAPATLLGSSLANPRSLFPGAITLTDTGVVVLGIESCDECQLKNRNSVGGFVAWFDEGGAFLGYRSASLGDGQDPIAARDNSPPVSEFAVAQGPVATAAIGGRLMILNPGFGGNYRETPIEGVESTDQWNIWQTPAWLQDVVVVPLPHSLSAFDATSTERLWSWSDGAGNIIDAMVPAAPSQVIVVQETFQFDGDAVVRNASLVRLDARTGLVLGRVSLPIVPEGSSEFLWSLDLSVLADGTIFLIDAHGRYLALGPGLPTLRPSIGLSDLYPGVGARVDVTVQKQGATSFVVNWGDGEFTRVAPGETASHSYVDRGDRDVQVTAYYADGRTGTSVQTVHVGATPPPELTALQKAFAPENQNITFGVLGIAITILGAIYTVGRHRRRLAKLERELAAVEEIRMLSTTDPRAAVIALKSYRDRLPEDLARRRIDDSQYQILEIRSARLLKVLRTRMFAPFDSRLTPRYHRLLDAAFEDAIIQPTEREALVAALDAEPALRPEDVREIKAILDDFTSARVDLHRRM